MLFRTTVIAGASLVLLSACGDSSSDSFGGVVSGELTDDTYCQIEGFETPERHTIILLDESAIAQTQDPSEFRAANGKLLDLVLSFADPSRVLSTGASAPRERISIYNLPRTGAAANRLFSGCIPGFSTEEMAQTRAESSAVADFFTGGKAQQIENDQSAFQTKLIGSVQVASRSAAGPKAPSTGELSELSFITSLKASGRILNAEEGVPRLVLYTDLSGATLPNSVSVETARSEGFAQGLKSGLDFGRSEMLVVQDVPGGELQRQYFDAFALMQQASVEYWGDARIGAQQPAPVTVKRFIGEAQYPFGPEAVQIRLAADQNGKLSNSWIVLRGAPDRSTPITGQMVCEATSCEVRSDEVGFAQAWSNSPGGEPEFLDDLPFSGLRDVEMTIQGDELTGKISDAAVDQVGPSGDSIPLTGTKQPNANF